MSARQRGRLIVGLLGLLLSVGYVGYTLATLPFGRLAQPGAAVFPVMAGALLALASVGVVFEQRRALAPAGPEPALIVRGDDRRRLLGVTASIVVYLVLLQVVGYLPATAVVSAALVHLLRLERGSWRSTALTAVLIAGLTYVLFVIVLDVPLPKGLLFA